MTRQKCKTTDNITSIGTGRGNVPVAIAARVLGTDPQSVRLLLQSGAVDWGIAYKRPNSTHYTYLIYAQQFCNKTGYMYKGTQI